MSDNVINASIKVVSIILLIITFIVMSTADIFAYSRNAAINYADKYAINANRLDSLGNGYNVYNDNDCTNFVSQCLYAGGMTQDSTWNSKLWFSSNVAHRTDSDAWVNADSLKNYLKNTGKASKIGSWSKNGSGAPYITNAFVNNSNNLTSNNTGKVVLFYDWEFDGTMNHSALFVADNSASTYSGEGTGDLVDQHSKNRKHVMWHADLRHAQTDQGQYQRSITRVYAFEIN